MGILTTWLPPIIVAAVTGFFSYLGVSKSAKATHDQTIAEIRSEQEKQALVIDMKFKEIKEDLKQSEEKQELRISGIKEDIIRLEQKQDKHNCVIERTYKLEQKMEDFEKRIK